MRTFARALLCGLFATTLGFAACGDDNKTTDTADTNTTDTLTNDTTTTDTLTNDTAADTNPGDTNVADTSDVTTPTNQCTNASDLAQIQAGKDGSGKAAECGGSSCISQLFVSIDAFESCVQTCMLNASFPNYEFAFSAECSSCYTKSVRCTAEFCGLSDPNKSCVPANLGGKGSDSADCATCRSENGCVSSFFACSGLTPPAN